MELIKYLNDNFLTREELFDITKVQEHEFLDYQNDKLMPTASYSLKLEMSSDSFFGVHKENLSIEYYAKGYCSWLGIIRSLKEQDLIYQEFSTRYEKTVRHLKSLGYHSPAPKVNVDLRTHISEEWEYFIQGIYGLCTKTGLPEDIAAKEFAIIQINEISEKETLNDDETKNLIRAVNLLDNVSSAFAPHERLKSSRHRLIDEIRRKYKLTR
jgi:hypothetical protein